MASSLQSGQVYVPRDVGELRDYMLTDFRLEARKDGAAEPAVQPGSDNYRFFNAVAHANMLALANVSFASKDTTPLDATGVELDRWREALGLPVVQASGSGGRVRVRVKTGSVTIADGTQAVLPNGLRVAVSGTHTSVADLDEVLVAAIDTGTATNQPGGTVVRWVNPPVNVEQEATVSTTTPLTGGYDGESDPRKRERVLNRLAFTRAGGDWGQLRQVAFETSPGVQGAFVYPALGGPGSTKLVVTKEYDESVYDFSRTPNTALLAAVTSRVYDEMPDEIEIIVQGAANENLDTAIHVTIPDAANSGGNGLGWVDATPWPPLVVGDSGRVTITGLSGVYSLTCSAATTTAPVAGQTHVAIWSSVDRRFIRALVIGVSGSSGAWSIVTDVPLANHLGTALAVGDYVCPDAVNIERYADTWVSLVRSLGPGENTTDTNRLPRSLRHPFLTDSHTSEINSTTLSRFVGNHLEVSNAAYGYTNLTAPTVPASVATAPNVLRLRNFGIYAQ